MIWEELGYKEVDIRLLELFWTCYDANVCPILFKF